MQIPTPLQLSFWSCGLSCQCNSENLGVSVGLKVWSQEAFSSDMKSSRSWKVTLTLRKTLAYMKEGLKLGLSQIRMG